MCPCSIRIVTARRRRAAIAAELRERARAKAKHLAVDRFREDVVGACVERIAPHLIQVERGNEHDRGIRELGHCSNATTYVESSMPGIITSRRMRCGRSRRAISSASAPELAFRIRYGWLRKTLSSVSRPTVSSSTMRTLQTAYHMIVTLGRNPLFVPFPAPERQVAGRFVTRLGEAGNPVEGNGLGELAGGGVGTTYVWIPGRLARIPGFQDCCTRSSAIPASRSVSRVVRDARRKRKARIGS